MLLLCEKATPNPSVAAKPVALLQHAGCAWLYLGHSASQRHKPAKLVLTDHFILGFREIKERVGWDPGQTLGEGRQLEKGEPGQRSL